MKLPVRSFINKVKDKVSDVTAGVAFGAYKNNKKARVANSRADAIRAGRGIPDSVLQGSHKDPAFRAKVNAMNAKSAVMFENKRLRAKIK